VGAPRVRQVDPSRDLGKFFRLKLVSSVLLALSRNVTYSYLARGILLRHQVGGGPARYTSSARSGDQPEMQLVVARVTAAAAVASEASAQTSLEVV
jgi:hypothetical protein